MASFTYDNDSQILTRAEFSPGDLTPSLFEGSPTDPRGSARWNGWNATLAGTFKLNAYFHGDQHPLAEQSGEQTRALVTLALQGGVPVYDAPSVHPYYLANPGDPGVAPVYGVPFDFTLAAADIAPNTGDPVADRQATLQNIATRAYASFAGLSPGEQAAILADLDTRVPPAFTDGTPVTLLGTITGKVNADINVLQTLGDAGLITRDEANARIEAAKTLRLEFGAVALVGVAGKVVSRATELIKGIFSSATRLARTAGAGLARLGELGFAKAADFASGTLSRVGLGGRTVRWVDESATMSSQARLYQSGAAGARSNVATRSPQAPQVSYTAADGSTKVVRFDGLEGNVLIDRKVSVTTFPKSQDQALRQSRALQQNGFTGRWEVPSAAEAARAQRMLQQLGITNIEVRIIKP